MSDQIQLLIAENERRNEAIFGTYDPISGVGCCGERVKVCIPDFFAPVQFVPKECLNSNIFKLVLKHKTIKNFVHDYMHAEYTDSRHQLVSMEICKARMREDPEFALYVCDKITDKKTGEMVPFKLNYPQRKLIETFEELRRKNEAIRVIILKARQWGGSTLTQLYIKWMQDFRHNGWNAIILAQVKATSKKIKAMYKKALKNQPGWTIGYPGAQLQFSNYENSTDDFIVTDGMRELRSSTLSVASFENYDNVRGDNFHCAHYSEVAYWKTTTEHDPEAVIASVSGGIRNQPDNIEVFESTGRGASGFFYDLCQQAMDPNNNSAYKFFFVPFYIIENDMEPVEDKEAFAHWLWNNRSRDTEPKGYKETGKFFWRMWKLGATFEAINWYRNYRNKFLSHAYMASEAPIDEVEAFRNSGNLIFNPYSIEELKGLYLDNKYHTATISMPAEKSFYAIQDAKLKFDANDLTVVDGELKVWAVNNNNIMRVKDRYVVCLDIGGASPKSDYSVMTVIDRLGMVKGVDGKPRVVARWRGHMRHDLLAWRAAALAHIYSDALLVIESNTADRHQNTEGDHFGTIIEEIADYYPNLYQRSASSEDVQKRVQMKYGFHTNKLTKQQVIDNLTACVDDQLYEEPDKEMYKELRIYERKDDGTMGNIDGQNNHDDVLMSTAIGLYVSFFDMDKPTWIKAKDNTVFKKPASEAVI